MTFDNWLTELSRLPLQALAILLAVFLLGFLAGVAYGRRQGKAERHRTRRRRIKREAQQAFKEDDADQWNTRFVPQEADPAPVASAAPPTQIMLAKKADPESRHAFKAVAQPVRVDASLRIKYVDHEGVGSYRSLRVQAFGRADGDVRVLAHCSLKNEVRCFHVSRILACVDKTDGGMIDDLPVFLKQAAATTASV